MNRKIVLLSDGTGNSSAKVWRTNVWRTFEALDLSGSEQVAFYDDGVGTSSFKPLAILGGAFGFGLKRNVIDIYKFACRNWEDDSDQLYGFGFSRGAFTIRVVMGLIINQGLVTAETESELDRKATAAYRAYRQERYHTYFRFEDIFRGIRDLFIRASYSKADNRTVKQIRFIGVWDTVAAYGMPMDEMTQGISKWLWPLELPDCNLNRERVQRACQALALDEERTTFHPVMWNERIAPPPGFDPDKERFIKDEKLSQVWFAGVHSNVGGGYPDDSLAYIPLVWMMTEAERCGLKFKSDAGKPPADPDVLKNAVSKRDKDGRIYDPRQGLGGYYRYGPRKLVQLCNIRFSKKEGDEVYVERPKIHESALKRISNRAHAYAPLGFPATYDVVTDAGAIVTGDRYGFETTTQALERTEAQEHTWNEIWKRRVVYFATVGTTLFLLAYPLLRAAPRTAEFTSPIRWVADLIRLLGTFLPSAAGTWINGYARSPIQFVVLLAFVAVFLWWGTQIAAQTADTMGSIWKRMPSAPTGLPKNWIYKLRSHYAYIGTHHFLKHRTAPFLFASGFLYLGIALSSHLLYNVQDIAGFVCRETDKSKPLARGEQLTTQFKTSEICHATGIFVETGGATYTIKVDAISAWMDGHVPTKIGGFYTIEAPTWYQRTLLFLAVPLRRELTRPWYRIVLRYGAVGGEEVFLDPDPTTGTIEVPIKPTRAGELFIFVNDAVTAIPGLYSFFYRNNVGEGTLTVKRR